MVNPLQRHQDKRAIITIVIGVLIMATATYVGEISWSPSLFVATLGLCFILDGVFYYGRRALNDFDHEVPAAWRRKP